MDCSMVPQEGASLQSCGYMAKILDISGESREKLLVIHEELAPSLPTFPLCSQRKPFCLPDKEVTVSKLLCTISI